MLLVAGIAGAGAMMNFKKVIELKSEGLSATTTSFEIVQVDPLEVRVKQAQDAAWPEIQKKAEAEFTRTVDSENLAIERAITAEYRAEIEAKEAELEAKASF